LGLRKSEVSYRINEEGRKSKEVGGKC
jgi:hypothetical protein